MPAVDVKETDKAYLMEADLPGMSEKDVDIRVDGDTLTLASERSEEKEDKNAGYLRRERYWQSFRRSFRLPEDVQKDKIDARFHNGVLTIEMPRTGQSKKERGRRIQIKSK
ncbi:MAG: Hsp20 family protein [Armatimonadia bacterium]|nr:Hsp20 family protein [Armatimonadia bacterium]